MDKPSPLLPFAFIRSVSNEKLPLDPAPRLKAHHVPSLKRKMGASFNEKDDIKRHELEWWNPPIGLNGTTQSHRCHTDITRETHTDFTQDSHTEYNRESHTDSTQESDDDIPLSDDLAVLRRPLPPSSPYHDDDDDDEDEPKSELDQSTQDAFLPQSPRPSSALASEIETIQSHASSEADFGIDKFHRFKTFSSQNTAAEGDCIPTTAKNAAYERARTRILQCFEDLRTVIDLEHMNLYDIPTEIKDLNSMVIFQYGSSQFLYQLFLTDNNLTSTCPALYKFTKLNVLGLRQNRLTCIPPCISKLVNLVNLSTSNNRIPFFPWQLLNLDRLEIFRAGPNPLVHPSAFEIDLNAKLGSINRHTRTAVSKMNILQSSQSASSLPSLKALCLNVIARYDVSYQETRSWKAHVPKTFHKVIASAIFKGRFGDHCAECDNIVVEPYAEVYEWWDILQNTSVPFRRQFCCGRCAKGYATRNLSAFKQS